MKDFVSIILPTYNSIKTISATIESVLNQTYDNWQLIIIDDGSSDDTIVVVSKYANNESRLKLILLGQNIGTGAARNKGLEEAKGHFIAFI